MRAETVFVMWAWVNERKGWGVGVSDEAVLWELVTG